MHLSFLQARSFLHWTIAAARVSPMRGTLVFLVWCFTPVSTCPLLCKLLPPLLVVRRPLRARGAPFHVWGCQQPAPMPRPRSLRLTHRFTAACSRSLVLKSALQLPVPLWSEVLQLMGGEYAELARDSYEGDE